MRSIEGPSPPSFAIGDQSLFLAWLVTMWYLQIWQCWKVEYNCSHMAKAIVREVNARGCKFLSFSFGLQWHKVHLGFSYIKLSLFLEGNIRRMILNYLDKYLPNMLLGQEDGLWWLAWSIDEDLVGNKSTERPQHISSPYYTTLYLGKYLLYYKNIKLCETFYPQRTYVETQYLTNTPTLPHRDLDSCKLVACLMRLFSLLVRNV